MFKAVPTVFFDRSSEDVLCLVSLTLAPSPSCGHLCDSEVELSV